MCVLVDMVGVKWRWVWILECLAVVARSFVDFFGLACECLGEAWDFAGISAGRAGGDGMRGWVCVRG